MLGLTEAYRLARIDRAKQVLSRATDLALRAIPEKALSREEQAARPHPDVSYTWDESYTLAENLFLAHETSGEERYLDLAKRYLHDQPFFEPLARGENVLPGLHAYSHVNALSSAAKAYLSLGNEMHLNAARNAWEMIERTQSYASGGWGPDEAFVVPGTGLLGASIARTRKHFETPCGSYAHMKLGRYLVRITGDARYGDGIERVLYNGILAAREMAPEGRTFYYSDYGPGARKTYHPDPWPCCAGTYPLAVADYGISAYFQHGSSLCVNLYVASQASCEVGSQRVRLTQQTDYPLGTTSRIVVEPAAPTTFALRLRVPRWAGAEFRWRVNGAPMPAAPGEDSFVGVTRTWVSGDRVEVELPLRDRRELLDPLHPHLAATLRGPLLLVTLDGPTWARLMPLFQVCDEPYTTYSPVSGTGGKGA